MAETFDDLGIAPELVAGVETLGWEAPTELQGDALPVIRRGNNVVLHASAGAGTVGAWGIGLLDHLLSSGDDDAPRPRALVLVPDTRTASLTAESLARIGAPAGLSARALAVGWADRPVDLLVAAAAAAGAAVRDSTLKLDTLTALVIDGADQLQATGQWPAVETLVEYAPAAAQKIVVAGRIDDALDGFLERHVRRALTIPPRPVEEESTSPAGTVLFAVAAEHDKDAAILQLLTPLEAPEVAVVCRTRDRAERVAAALAARGLPVTGHTGRAPTEDDAADAPVRVLPALEADQRSSRADVLSFDVPFDPESLAALHGRGGAVIVTPREIPHLRRIARRASFKLRPVPLTHDAALTPAEAVRERLRQSLATDDLSADLALIEPLLQEFTAPEIAAAALRLARGEVAAAAAAGGGEGVGARTTATAAAAPAAGAGAPPPATNWVRLFVSAGTRDGLGPGDLVGAITGETGLAGEKVGKIEVSESHSTVEVPSEVAAQVIQALNGRSLRGRSLRVDYDRKGRPGTGGGRASGPTGRTGGRPGGRPPTTGGRPGGGRTGGKPGGRAGGKPGGRRPGPGS